MERDTLTTRKAAVLDRLNVTGLVAELFDHRTPAGRDQVLVRCPVHQDEHASCSVNTASGLWNCKACGDKGNVFDLIAARLGLDFIAALSYLEDRAGITPLSPTKRTPPKSTAKHSTAKPKTKPKAAPVKGKTVAVYRYFDATGNYRYQKRRIEPGRDGKKKEFAFSHPLPNDTEAPGRGDCPPLLYGLHRLATAPPEALVFVVEGEGKADALAAWGLVAVCTDSGATGKWPEGFGDLFAGRTVVILPDNDTPGEKYAAKVAAALLPVAAAVKVLRLPDLPPKGDLIDFIACHQKGAE